MAQLQIKMRTKPYWHQLDCLERNLDKRYFAYLMEMGTGKSKVLIDTAANLFLAGKIDSLLVTANKGAYCNWGLLEIPRHMPENVTYRQYIWEAGQSDKKLSEYEKFACEKTTGELKILIVNTEGFSYPQICERIRLFLAENKTLFAVDESTSIKNIKANRTKAVIRLGQLAIARRIMTGSPVTRDPLDLYSQFQFLNPGLLGFTSYYAFRAYYAVLKDTYVAKNRMIKTVTGFKNLDELTIRVKQYAYIIKKEQCLDLPAKSYTRKIIDLTDEQRRIYDEIRLQSLAEISKTAEISVQLVLTKLLRLHQVTCGHVTDDTGKTHRLATSRLSVLDEIIDETDDSLIIWATYVADIERIVEYLTTKHMDKTVVASYYGKISQEAREQAKKDFMEKRARYFVATPMTGGYGLTLTASATVVYYSNSFDYALRIQSEDRCHRIGQTRPVTYTDIIARDTVDEKIMLALSNKKDLAQLIIQDPLNIFKDK